MQSRRERQIVHFDFVLDTNPPGSIENVREIADFLVERVSAGLCVRKVENERYLIAITSARVVSKLDGSPVLALLFSFADPDVADSANMHLDTRTVRFFNLEEGEGRVVSAHAIIDLTPRHGSGGRVFRVLLESVNGLGKTRVRAELARELAQVFKDKEIKVTNLNGDQVPARPTIDMTTVASERLKNSVREGATIKEITLVDARGAERGFDQPDPVKRIRREMQLKVEVPLGQTVEQVLKRIQPWARDNNFEEMYVSWTRPRQPAGSGESAPIIAPERAKITLAQEDIGETLFARKDFVRLGHALPDYCIDFSDELLAKMVAILV